MAIWDNENKQTIEMISNNFSWAASTICRTTNKDGKLRFFPEYQAVASSKPSLEHLKMQLKIQIWKKTIQIYPKIPKNP